MVLSNKKNKSVAKQGNVKDMTINVKTAQKNYM